MLLPVYRRDDRTPYAHQFDSHAICWAHAFQILHHNIRNFVFLAVVDVFQHRKSSSSDRIQNEFVYINARYSSNCSILHRIVEAFFVKVASAPLRSNSDSGQSFFAVLLTIGETRKSYPISSHIWWYPIAACMSFSRSKHSSAHTAHIYYWLGVAVILSSVRDSLVAMYQQWKQMHAYLVFTQINFDYFACGGYVMRHSTDVTTTYIHLIRSIQLFP